MQNNSEAPAKPYTKRNQSHKVRFRFRIFLDLKLVQCMFISDDHVSKKVNKEQAYKGMHNMFLSATEYLTYKTSGRIIVLSMTTIRERFYYLMKCRIQAAQRNSNA